MIPIIFSPPAERPSAFLDVSFPNLFQFVSAIVGNLRRLVAQANDLNGRCKDLWQPVRVHLWLVIICVAFPCKLCSLRMSVTSCQRVSEWFSNTFPQASAVNHFVWPLLSYYHIVVCYWFSVYDDDQCYFRYHFNCAYIALESDNSL